jgi:glycerol-3-phosphate acyltransferase PlsY
VPLGAAVLGYPLVYVLAALAVSLIIVGRHHANIGRLLAGTESRLGQRSPA